jgi:hypothetical protein
MRKRIRMDFAISGVFISASGAASPTCDGNASPPNKSIRYEWFAKPQAQFRSSLFYSLNDSLIRLFIENLLKVINAGGVFIPPVLESSP